MSATVDTIFFSFMAAMEVVCGAAAAYVVFGILRQPQKPQAKERPKHHISDNPDPQ
jgi:hypothetical protein